MRLIGGWILVLGLGTLAGWLLFEELAPRLVELEGWRDRTQGIEGAEARLFDRHPEIPSRRRRLALKQRLAEVEAQLEEIESSTGVLEGWPRLPELEALVSHPPAWFAAYEQHKERLVARFAAAAARSGEEIPDETALIESVLPLYSWELDAGSLPDGRELVALTERLAFVEWVLEAASEAKLFGLESVSFVRPSRLRAPVETGLRGVPIRIEGVGRLEQLEELSAALLKDGERALVATIESQRLERLASGEVRDGAAAPIRFRLDLTAIVPR